MVFGIFTSPEFIVNKKEKYILAVGSKLELKCSLKGGCYESTELDINKLKIIHCKSSSMCSVKDTTVVDNNVCMISFTEDNVTLQDMGTYFCQYNEVNKTRDNIYIRTGCKYSIFITLCCAFEISKMLTPQVPGFVGSQSLADLYLGSLCQECS